MHLLTLENCQPPDMDPPQRPDFISSALWFSAGVMMACLASVWKLLRDTPPDTAIPRRVLMTAIIGGFLSGVAVMGTLIHLYGWEHPWAILVVSIPAGFGAPLILAAFVNTALTIIKAAGEVISKRSDDK